MQLTKPQFDVLALAERKKDISPKEISCLLKMPIAQVSEALTRLSSVGFIDGCNVTADGLKALEPYRVKRAIFIAAGMGSRMLPITLSCPKPLVRVNGVRIIDTLIDACIDAGVEEIIVVRGYLKECFNQLTDKYPNIKFIDNPYYETYNNISSAYLVRDLIGGSYIFESDIYLVNKDLITKYQYRSNYLGVPCEETPDWCFDTDENLRITNLRRGGVQMFTICTGFRTIRLKWASSLQSASRRFSIMSWAARTAFGTTFCATLIPISRIYMCANVHSAILWR